MPPLTEIARCITETRRARGITQSDLARQVNCKQSAISMLERGYENALSGQKVDAILKLLDISLPERPPPQPPPSVVPLRYCPVFDCPSNLPVAVQNRLLFFPNPHFPPAAAPHCPACGELLECKCPECGAVVNPGACCIHCGVPYVSAPPEAETPPSPAVWSETRQQQLRALGMLP